MSNISKFLEAQKNKGNTVLNEAKSIEKAPEQKDEITLIIDGFIDELNKVVSGEYKQKAKVKSDVKPEQNAEEQNGNKMVNKISKKMNYLDKLIVELQNGTSQDISKTKDAIEQVCGSINNILPNINHDQLSEDEKKILLTAADKVAAAKIIINNSASNPAVAAANNTGYGFNISNFIKPAPVPQQQINPAMQFVNPAVIPPQQPQQRPSVFPHQMCGLKDEEIVEYVQKHFKVIEKLNAYALYDLVNNKLLAKKMKELDCKQRSSNPFLTQVPINEYIDIPELLAQYPLCFTLPCNDKKQLIIVLFNPTPVLNKNGVMEYPMNIFKAKKTQPQSSKKSEAK